MKVKLLSLVTLLGAMTLTACGGNPGGGGGGQTAEHDFDEDEWTEVSTTGKFTKEKCSCGLIGYRCNVEDADGWNDPTTKMNGKTEPNNKSTWAANGLPAGKYDIWFNCKMSYDSHSSRYWYNQWETDTASSPDTEDEDPFRYWIEIDSKQYNPTRTEDWGECGLSGSSFNDTIVIENATVASGAQNVSLVHGNIGYSLAIAYVRFVAK